MRVLNSSAGTDSHSHNHSRGHSHGPSEGKTTAISDSSTTLRPRKTTSDVTPTSQTVAAEAEKTETNPSLRLSAYLNLFGDFTHNITDGLAMAASFYSSPALGAVTTIATFCHEIPHEVSSSPLGTQFIMSS